MDFARIAPRARLLLCPSPAAIEVPSPERSSFGRRAPRAARGPNPPMYPPMRPPMHPPMSPRLMDRWTPGPQVPRALPAPACDNVAGTRGLSHAARHPRQVSQSAASRGWEGRKKSFARSRRGCFVCNPDETSRNGINAAHAMP
jgi:hypothetical protein